MFKDTKKVALGTANLNQEYGGRGRSSFLGVDEAEKIIEYILSRGNCSIETSSQYGNSEKILGKLLNNVKFEAVTTKIPPKILEDASVLKSHVYKSLENLRQDRIESILLHGGTEKFETCRAEIETGLTELLEEGVVSRVGFSAYVESEIKLAKDYFPFMSQFQILENIADQRLRKSRYLAELNSSGNFLQVRSIFLQGKLLFSEKEAKELFPELLPVIVTINELSEQFGNSRSEICLEYAKLIPWVDELVVGVDSFQNFVEIFEFVHTAPQKEMNFGNGLNSNLIDPRSWLHQ